MFNSIILKRIFYYLVISQLILIISCSNNQVDGLRQWKNSSGEVYLERTYKDGVLHGPWRSYYDNGQTWSEGNYENGKMNGLEKTYTPSGELAVESHWKRNQLFEKKIYWQVLPNSKSNYLLVSKEGYYTVRNGIPVKNDKNTPNNIIEKIYNREKEEFEYFIWKKGTKVQINEEN